MLPFKHSFTSLVSGPTGYGKTIFVMRLIDNVVALIELTPDKIVYYFAEYQPQFDRYTRERLTDALVVFNKALIECVASARKNNVPLKNASLTA